MSVLSFTASCAVRRTWEKMFVVVDGGGGGGGGDGGGGGGVCVRVCSCVCACACVCVCVCVCVFCDLIKITVFLLRRPDRNAEETEVSPGSVSTLDNTSHSHALPDNSETYTGSGRVAISTMVDGGRL